MKKQLVIILIVIEIVGIFTIGLLYSKWHSSYYVYSIEIPNGMQLTTNKSLELFTLDGTVNISEGEKVIPIGAVKPYVYFTQERGASMLSSTWDNFVEQEQLDELQKTADMKSEEAKKLVRTKDTIISTIIVICWLGIAGAATYLLLKINRIKALLIGHGIAISIVLAMLVILILNI
jgi:sensor c-di-GMP phosphodiesterase-like protein